MEPDIRLTRIQIGFWDAFRLGAGLFWGVVLAVPAAVLVLIISLIGLVRQRPLDR